MKTPDSFKFLKQVTLVVFWFWFFPQKTTPILIYVKKIETKKTGNFLVWHL